MAVTSGVAVAEAETQSELGNRTSTEAWRGAAQSRYAGGVLKAGTGGGGEWQKRGAPSELQGGGHGDRVKGKGTAKWTRQEEERERRMLTLMWGQGEFGVHHKGRDARHPAGCAEDACP